MEIYKDIPGYEGSYQVSNYGNVKSLDRTVKHKKYGLANYKGRQLKKIEDSNGYYYVNLPKRKIKRVHQLVAEAFLNHKSNGFEKIVDHVDNNPKNNHVNNLRVTSQRKNCLNRKKKYSSNYAGVTWHKQGKKWLSQININNTNVYLGLHDTEIGAHEAYKRKLEKHKRLDYANI